MHGSKLELTVWFWAAYLMATRSNGGSTNSCSASIAANPPRRLPLTAWHRRHHQILHLQNADRTGCNCISLDDNSALEDVPVEEGSCLRRLRMARGHLTSRANNSFSTFASTGSKNSSCNSKFLRRPCAHTLRPGREPARCRRRGSCGHKHRIGR
jgi:hypothetical protein